MIIRSASLAEIRLEYFVALLKPIAPEKMLPPWGHQQSALSSAQNFKIGHGGACFLVVAYPLSLSWATISSDDCRWEDEDEDDDELVNRHLPYKQISWDQMPYFARIGAVEPSLLFLATDLPTCLLG